MVRGKRVIVSAGSLLATMALFGCAPAGSGYGQSGSANNALPVNAAASGAPVATPSAPPSPAPSAPAEPAGSPTTSLTAKNISKMGAVVTDDKGWVLYRFDKDTVNPSTSACSGTCAQIWPPITTEGGATPTLTGVDPAKVGTLTRSDGTTQLTLNGWPLYRYIGDTKPGQWKGQAVGGTWWVIAPTGAKNLTCVPKGTPTAVPPPNASPAANTNTNGAGGDSGGYSY